MEAFIMDELKHILLAGIGLTSMTYEKADSFVKELVEKGRVTVEEGKELQTELKRKSEAEAAELLSELKSETKAVQYATKEDLERLEAKLDRLLDALNKD